MAKEQVSMKKSDILISKSLRIRKLGKNNIGKRYDILYIQRNV